MSKPQYKVGDIFQDAPFAPEMVVVPAGRFMMGTPEGHGYSNEYPQHEVRIAEDFAVGRFPVTFDEYDHYCDVNGHKKPDDEGWGRDRRPVINVSRDDAKEYIKWLSRAVGSDNDGPYSLLSEAQWEYACRAGTKTRYSFGDTITKEQAQFSEGGRVSAKHTVPVGEFQPNDFGLYDMHGNVWEWCEDCWHDDYKNAPLDGSAWLEANNGDCKKRVLRGGSAGTRFALRGRSTARLRGYYDHYHVTRTL